MEAEQLFHTGNHFDKLGLICLPGSEELTAKIDRWLVDWAAMGPEARDTFVVGAECPRFQSGDAKALIHDSVRGMDIYIIADVYNYSCTYTLFGIENRGFIRPGYHADLAVFEPGETVVTRESLLYKCGWSPIQGQTLHTRLRQVFLNGMPAGQSTAMPLQFVK